jgi:peptidyl-dipeptidase A
MNSKLLIKTLVLTVLVFVVSCRQKNDEKQLSVFINNYVAKMQPLEEQYNQAYWDAAAAGKKEKFEQQAKLELALRQLSSDPKEYAQLKDWKDTGRIKDAKLKRQLDKLYFAYLQNQIDPNLMERIVALNNKIQENYSNFRGTIDGNSVTMSDIYTILTKEKDSRKRELTWKASKQVGNTIAADLISLVKLRNEAARKVGFDNYHTMSIVTGEQSVEDLDKIFAQLDELTKKPFAEMKAELDQALAKSYGISFAELKPWHYHDPFFQRVPLIYEVDLDSYYSKVDVKEIAQKYYAGIGLPIDDILAASDLYDRPGKYPHAFGMAMDRNGHSRVLANLQNTERWMETLLHEVGHALYSKYHDTNEPYLLREPAHSFTTEAVAMFFGRLSQNASWMKQMLGLSEQEKEKIEAVTRKYQRCQQLILTRWVLVMYNFEKQLYANPDQDLNNLWWQLVEKYQLVKRPPGPVDAGWASKLHFVSAPCYYHNYMLGELLASQWHHYFVHNVFGLKSDKAVSYVGDKRIGNFFREKVFAPGAVYYWNDMIECCTGEKLTPNYYVEQFVK